MKKPVRVAPAPSNDQHIKANYGISLPMLIGKNHQGRPADSRTWPGTLTGQKNSMVEMIEEW